MTNFFLSLHPIWQGFLATVFTWGVTAAGASLVFFFKSVNRKLLDGMMGFAAGVMIAASFWSLLAPAIELADSSGASAALICALGFLSGGLFVMAGDILLEKMPSLQGENTLRRSILLVTSVTMHNFPEGLAVGVAFGTAALGIEGATVGAAVMLALGIGLQNFPEGTCVAMPLRREGVSRAKSFFYGQLSGMVEPIGGILGVAFALTARSALPFVLSFSAGCMIAVVCSELIPEAFRDSKRIASVGVLLGFIVMMYLDVTLG